ncbi:phosphate acetyltransferase [Spongiactinospora gelatinilytica]|uniref:Phosphate acetyltransferase n=1 Tax=Spongiactinospora gelatinilytica TaxID=2666298 RepID=A0A2W2HL58_9ACTN|nr:phosphate acetyltransferase [Spongiactinospora gelatinilytica]PZG50478.1 phosphate acetyltransferase [Spongiactinospora gelatinilytica]
MRSIYVAGVGPKAGRDLVELGLMELLSHRVERIAVCRPIACAGDGDDHGVELLRSRYLVAGYARGMTREEAAEVPEEKLVARLADGVRTAGEGCAAMLVLGCGERAVPGRPDLDAELAAELDAPVVAVVAAGGMRAEKVAAALRAAHASFARHGCRVLAMIANRVTYAGSIPADLPVPWYVIPEHPRLAAPTVRQAAEATRATLVQGNAEGLLRDVLGYVFGGASLPIFLDHLREGALVISPGDRADVLLGALAAGAAGTARPAGVVLTLGEKPPPNVRGLTARLAPEIPVLSAPPDSFTAAAMLSGLRGRITPDNPRKVETALGHFTAHVDTSALAARMDLVPDGGVTPRMFTHRLVVRAAAVRRHIVLPEGCDERVLAAADTIVRRGIAEVTLLGQKDDVRRRARVLGLDLHAVRVIDPVTSPLRETFAETYGMLRDHKSVSHRRARDVLTDPVFFGAMMTQAGMVHGMVTGATHPTAGTLTAAFQIIRTAPGTRAVSAVSFACLPHQVLVYGDCGVHDEPDDARLAEIAIASAVTAERFGIEARVAMLSYSAGPYGAGADADKVRRATELVQTRAPGLPVEGPIHFDAAVDERVAAVKAPGSAVAGRATVLVFPDLDSAESACTAVRRSAGGLVIGPILQGLRQPVNDLPRNATVEEIIDTVAITVIQAQGGIRRNTDQ